MNPVQCSPIERQVWEQSAAMIAAARAGDFLSRRIHVADVGWAPVLSSAFSRVVDVLFNSLLSEEGFFRLILLHLLAYSMLFSGMELLAKKWRLTKINSTETVSAGTLRRERLRTFSSAIVDAAYAYLIAHYGLLYDGPLPFWTLLQSSLIIFVTVDVHFYWTHRLLHWPPLFRAVHYAHHESRNPSCWSSVSFHPVEAAIFFSTYLVALVMPFHIWVWYAFKVFAVLGPLHAHLGYDLGKSSYISNVALWLTIVSLMMQALY